MSKSLCKDGAPIDQKVRNFQLSRRSEDFIPVQEYYDGFRDFWYKQVEDLIERDDFNREWHAKLFHSMETYKEDKAILICRSQGWSMTNKFNRWFYSALKNWICNIKTQSFRTKRRPGIICPICYREVAKIEERHLLHIREAKDFPKVFKYSDRVFKTMFKPRKEARVFDCSLRVALKMHNIKTYTTAWPWVLENGDQGVFCPLTKTIVPEINEEHINSLPKKHKHYATPYTWFGFQQEFPSYMVHSEIMSLDYTGTHNDNRVFIDYVRTNKRILGSICPSYTCSVSELNPYNSPPEYEYSVNAIEKHVNDETDREILKHIMVGHDTKYVCEELGISRKEFKTRITQLKSNKPLELILVDGV